MPYIEHNFFTLSIAVLLCIYIYIVLPNYSKLRLYILYILYIYIIYIYYIYYIYIQKKKNTCVPEIWHEKAIKELAIPNRCHQQDKKSFPPPQRSADGASHASADGKKKQGDFLHFEKMRLMAGNHKVLELFGISVSIWHVHFAAKLCSVSLVCSVPQIFLSPTKSRCFSRISRRRASRLRYDIFAALKETVGKHGSAEGGPFLGRGQSIPLPFFFYHLPIRT